MEEKVLIRGEVEGLGKLLAVFITVGVILGLVALCIFSSWNVLFIEHEEIGNCNDCNIFDMATETQLIWFIIILSLMVLTIILGVIVYFAFSKIELAITNKRISGFSTFGKRVDLPLDAVSAVSYGALSTIAVSTSSGLIKFSFIGNYYEIFNTISKLLTDRQSQKTESSLSNADELKKYKELLDGGIISEAEFEAKKKQLLGL